MQRRHRYGRWFFRERWRGDGRFQSGSEECTGFGGIWSEDGGDVSVSVASGSSVHVELGLESVGVASGRSVGMNRLGGARGSDGHSGVYRSFGGTIDLTGYELSVRKIAWPTPSTAFVISMLNGAEPVRSRRAAGFRRDESASLSRHNTRTYL